MKAKQEAIASAPGRRVGRPWRLFFALFLPVSALIVGGAWYITADRIDDTLAMIRTDEANNVVLGVRRIDGELRRPLDYLRRLAADEGLAAALASGQGITDRALQGRLQQLLGYNPELDEIRLYDKTGMARLWIRRTADGGVTLASTVSVAPADPRFMERAWHLPKGRMLISPLDLDAEGDTVVIPHKPIFRLAMPIVDDSSRRIGLIALEVDATALLKAFIDSVGKHRDRILLVGAHGPWLRKAYPHDDWAYRFKREETLAARHPEAWQVMRSVPSSQSELRDGLWTWSTAYPVPGPSEEVEDSQRWLVISHLDPIRLAQVRQEAWGAVLPWSLLLLLAFAALSWWMAWVFHARRRAELEATLAHQQALDAERIAAANERFHKLFETNANGILVVDEEGGIVMANPALLRMFGYEREELVGQPVERLLPESKRALHRSQREQYLRSPVDRPMGVGRELLGLRRDGTTFPVEVSLSTYTDQGRVFVDAVVADISTRVKSLPSQ